ncbi:Electron transport protein [Modestobacter italicus]|uniref:Electron transport protein n=1 Tax=Modestobacter italicus (strain DSM 44449 / CECT 9708 / BC 501) TaxID=2732864 RepID=I4EVH0_MODI5|nr:SCO family protein [Modestobacter marinus]CCH87383.1 Electron transport protein [Modestobacter marinus]
MLRRTLTHRIATTLVCAGMAVPLVACGGGDTQAHDEHPASVSSSADDGPYAGRELAEPKARPAFTLTDQTGSAFDFAARTAGQPTLLFFGYANCPDVCPTTMADVAIALRSTPADVAARTQVVFVTTDPARDTADFLGEYLARFDEGLPNRFIGLTGTQTEVEAAQTAAGVPLAENDGTMHATSLYLFGNDDLARVVFSAGDTSGEIAQDLEAIAAA